MVQPNHQREKGVIERIGCEVSSFVSDIAANPIAQIGVIVVCALWFLIGFATELLTAILSILAITLTQMVLNRQNEREADAHRRDVALHAKIDELVLAMRGARDEMAGIEELEEEEIEELKVEAKQAIDEAGEAAGDPHAREVAKKAIEQAAERARKESRNGKSRKRPSGKGAQR